MTDPEIIKAAIDSVTAMFGSSQPRQRLAEYLHLQSFCPDGVGLAERMLAVVAASDEYLDDLTLQIKAVDALRVINPEMDEASIRADVDEAFYNLCRAAVQRHVERAAA